MKKQIKIKPHIMILSGVWPHIKGNKEAANVICHEVASKMLDSGRFQMSYCVINAFNVSMPEIAGDEVAELKDSGMQFLGPLKIPVSPVADQWWKKLIALFSRRLDKLLVGTGRHKLLIELPEFDMPDAVLVVWSEQAGYLASLMPCQRFNYAGNPDYKVLGARAELDLRLGKLSLIRKIRGRLVYLAVQIGHINTMRRYDLMWNVAANDALEYAAKGVNARYLQNMWPNKVSNVDSNISKREEQLHPLKIVGNVGNLFATGNSFGLITLVKDIIPILRRRLGKGEFEIHLFGAGEPHKAVAPLLKDPHVKLRGFVDDLDSEIISAPIFLVANNSQNFKVGHTRFLHAWSLKACIVGFKDSSEAMPEIVHGENALLGETVEQVANLVIQAAQDSQLRKKISMGGIKTLNNYFSPSKVVDKMIKDIEVKYEG
jgi:glycosyltransferase involved in cell wall biosynthesis